MSVFVLLLICALSHSLPHPLSYPPPPSLDRYTRTERRGLHTSDLFHPPTYDARYRIIYLISPLVAYLGPPARSAVRVNFNSCRPRADAVRTLLTPSRYTTVIVSLQYFSSFTLLPPSLQLSIPTCLPSLVSYLSLCPVRVR